MSRYHDANPRIPIGLASALLFLVASCGCSPREAADRPGRGTAAPAASSTTAAPVSAAARRSPMEVLQSSRSLILRASHILVVRVDSADPKPWSKLPDGNEERIVALELHLEEIVKGQVSQKAGDTVHVEAKQVQAGFAWGPMPGIWSNAPIEPGTRLVAFAHTASEDAAAALNDPGGVQLLSTEEALVDVQLAARIDAGKLDLAAAIALARPQAAAVQHLFADYLWAHYEAVAMASIEKFELVAGFLEEPALHRLARATLLMTLATAVQAPEPPALKHVSRLAIAMFHLLALPEAGDLHDNLVGTHLPNLLDITNKDARPPSEVFEDHPAERARAIQIVGAYHGGEPSAPLLAWLGR